MPGGAAPSSSSSNMLPSQSNTHVNSMHANRSRASLHSNTRHMPTTKATTTSTSALTVNNVATASGLSQPHAGAHQAAQASATRVDTSQHMPRPIQAQPTGAAAPSSGSQHHDERTYGPQNFGYAAAALRAMNLPWHLQPPLGALNITGEQRSQDFHDRFTKFSTPLRFVDASKIIDRGPTPQEDRANTRAGILTAGEAVRRIVMGAAPYTPAFDAQAAFIRATIGKYHPLTLKFDKEMREEAKRVGLLRQADNPDAVQWTDANGKIW